MCIGDIMQESQVYDNFDNEFDEELTIDIKKIFFTVWNGKYLLIKIFSVVLLFFILLTFFTAKKYTVEADLYINKSNYTNLAEFNPFVIESQTEDGFSVSNANKLTNEIELIKSSLVIDNVIHENNLIYKKKFGIFTTPKTGKYLSTKAFIGKGKNPKFDNIKNTNILKIRYTSKNPEVAYNIVNSIINNYIELQQSLNTEKSKSDKAIIEKEYNKAKAQLSSNLNQSSGLPESAVSGMSNFSALSAFSTSASKAIANLKGQILSGKRSQIAVSEQAAKTAELSSKLEWARIVEEMSNNSKVLIINPPVKPEAYEQTSPNLLSNILLGIVFGLLLSLLALIIKETTSKTLTYSMIGDNAIYSLRKNLTELKTILLTNKDKNVAFVAFDDTYADIKEQNLGKYPVITAEISEEFVTALAKVQNVILFEKINQTDSKFYKQIKSILKDMNKNIIKEVLV